MARNMVTRYGMSDAIGPIQFGSDNEEVFIGRDLAHSRNYSESVATLIDDEIKRIIKFAYTEAERLINGNMTVLHKTAELLIEKEKITGAEFRELFEVELPKKQTAVNEATAKEIGLIVAPEAEAISEPGDVE
jgi:cell division protease FtsH